MEQFVELPEELKSLLFVGVVFLVTQALKFISDLIGKDLSGHAAETAAGITAALVVIANAALSNVPSDYAPLVAGGLQFVVVLLGSFGLYAAYRKISPKG